MNKPNAIVFCKDHYEKEADMWKAISDTLRILTNEEYIAVFRCDEQGLGIYVIEYDYESEDLCDVRPYWLPPDFELKSDEDEKGE